MEKSSAMKGSQWNGSRLFDVIFVVLVIEGQGRTSSSTLLDHETESSPVIPCLSSILHAIHFLAHFTLYYMFRQSHLSKIMFITNQERMIITIGFGHDLTDTCLGSNQACHTVHAVIQICLCSSRLSDVTLG